MSGPPRLVRIRPEEPLDHVRMHAIHVAAFETPAEANRVGFASGVRVGLGCEYDVPAEAFMVLELRPGALRGATGRVQYHGAFASL